MRRLVPIKLALVSVLIAACVTINVYFPAAAAEKAADKIIEDVWGKDQAPAPTPPTDKTSSLAPQAGRVLFAAAGAAKIAASAAPAAGSGVGSTTCSATLRTGAAVGSGVGGMGVAVGGSGVAVGCFMAWAILMPKMG